MKEIFVDIKGFEGRYKISNKGTILSIGGKWKGKKKLYGVIDCEGYRKTTLRMKPKKRNVRVHTLVGEHFLIKPFENLCINHKDGNKLNNNVTNLEWITIGENTSHAFRTGLINFKGENHPMSKLVNENIMLMRKMRSEGKTHQAIADSFGMSRRHIGDILNGVCWGWLT